MTRKRLLMELDGVEISAWEAFYRIEEEDRRRGEMQARAEQGVKQARKRRR